MNSLLRTGVALVALHCSGLAFAAGEGWTSDFAAAKKEAATSGKDLLVDFTGSDWCGWCIKLHKEVFDLEPFEAGVKDKFVLVDLDYPRNKSKLTPETIKQNEELAKQYGIKGYPTILLCDETGKPFAATGYQEGGPEAYVKSLDELRTKKAVRDEAVSAAAKLEGMPKAKVLVDALDAMKLDDAVVANFYPQLVAQIKEADPQDETGYAKAVALRTKVEEVNNAFNALLEAKDPDGAVTLVDKTLKEGGFSQDDTQQFMLNRALVFANQGKLDESLKALDETKAYAPESKLVEDIDKLKVRIEAAKNKPAADKAEGGKAPEPKPGT